jgi:hypothetical protein
MRGRFAEPVTHERAARLLKQQDRRHRDESKITAALAATAIPHAAPDAAAMRPASSSAATASDCDPAAASASIVPTSACAGPSTAAADCLTSAG